MQLGQAESIRTVNNQGIRVGNIEAGFHDGGTHQNVEIMVPEINDDAFQLMFVELPVGNSDPRLGNKFLDVRGDRGDGVHAIVHVEDLAIAQKLASNGRADLRVGVCADESKDGLAFFGRGLKNRHLANTRNCHFQGPGDGRCGH